MKQGDKAYCSQYGIGTIIECYGVLCYQYNHGGGNFTTIAVYALNGDCVVVTDENPSLTAKAIKEEK